jgi:hypothetical protein
LRRNHSQTASRARNGKPNCQQRRILPFCSPHGSKEPNGDTVPK